MKKHLSFLLLCLCCTCLLALASCSCTGKENGPNSNNAMSWQENYDLGIRLLSEGNYEEAILAFQAAIQIDPKQAETYLHLASAYISTGNYDAATDILLSGIDNSEQESYLPEFDRQLHYIEFLQSKGIGVHILDVEFDQNTYLAKRETIFTVTVAYRCPAGTESYLDLGDNCSNEAPNLFYFYGEPFIVTGEGTTTMSCAMVPIQQYGFPLGLIVNLSPFDNSGDADDLIFLDEEGNLYVDPDFSQTEDPSTGPDLYADPENTQNSLFSAYPNAGLSIEELTLFGTPIKGLSYDNACSIATQNNFPRYIHSEPEDNYYGLYQGEYDPSLHIYPNESSADGSLNTIAYLHYMTIDDAGREIRDPETTPVWTGIRDIYTYDSLNDVLAALGYSNSEAIASYIQSILSMPAPEADTQLRMLRSQGWCCDVSGVTTSEDSDRILYWSFTWYGEDPQTQHLYSAMFEFHVDTDSLTHVTISVY